MVPHGAHADLPADFAGGESRRMDVGVRAAAADGPEGRLRISRVESLGRQSHHVSRGDRAGDLAVGPIRTSWFASAAAQEDENRAGYPEMFGVNMGHVGLA